jgi:pyrroloquinoline-quinone synthase
MNNQSVLWFEKLDKLIQQKHMLISPFYQAWSCGASTKATLQSYAKEYYQQLKAFPTYISALHSRCDDPEIRKSLLTNLIDEESGCSNRLDLWKSFALAVGVDPKELNIHKPQAATGNLINHYRNNCRSQPLAVGLAPLIAMKVKFPPFPNKD